MPPQTRYPGAGPGPVSTFVPPEKFSLWGPASTNKQPSQCAKILEFLIQTAYQRTAPVQKRRTVPAYHTSSSSSFFIARFSVRVAGAVAQDEAATPHGLPQGRKSRGKWGGCIPPIIFEGGCGGDATPPIIPSNNLSYATIFDDLSC